MGQKRKIRYTRPTHSEIGEFRRFLGPLAAEYNYAKLVQLRWEMHEMAEVLLDFYLSRREKGQGAPREGE